ncbi:MAG: cation:proton antiporter [Kiritimatiellia bacterium]
MDNVIFLQDLAVVMMVAGLVALLFRRLRQPVILGYIVAGLIVGPHMPPFLLVQNVSTIETLAQLGVVFLMFSLGLEFSFRKLRMVGLPAMITSVFEILVMMLLGHQGAGLLGWSPAERVFLGCILAVSSTAMIITSLRTSGRIREDQGQFVAGLLIMEDVFVILMMVLLPGLARTGEIPAREVLLTILRLFTFLVGLVVAGLITVPRFLRHVARHNSDEMLLITTLALCFGTALLAVRMEFSVALGAFIMGAIIAEAREAPRVERLMAPVRDLFMAVFFVAIGMLIQPSFLLDHLVPILAITLVFIAGKLAACAAGAFITGRDLTTSLRIGANMAQLGEFAFVLAALGRQWKVTGDFLYPVIAGVTVLNAVLRPYLIEAADPLAGFLRRNLPDSWVSAMTVFNRRVREMVRPAAAIR